MGFLDLHFKPEIKIDNVKIPWLKVMIVMIVMVGIGLVIKSFWVTQEKIADEPAEAEPTQFSFQPPKIQVILDGSRDSQNSLIELENIKPKTSRRGSVQTFDTFYSVCLAGTFTIISEGAKPPSLRCSLGSDTSSVYFEPGNFLYNMHKRVVGPEPQKLPIKLIEEGQAMDIHLNVPYSFEFYKIDFRKTEADYSEGTLLLLKINGQDIVAREVGRICRNAKDSPYHIFLKVDKCGWSSIAIDELYLRTLTQEEASEIYSSVYLKDYYLTRSGNALERGIDLSAR